MCGFQKKINKITHTQERQHHRTKFLTIRDSVPGELDSCCSGSGRNAILAVHGIKHHFEREIVNMLPNMTMERRLWPHFCHTSDKRNSGIAIIFKPL